ncbi:hypothetical protein PMX66_05280 [Collinsella aerofaciens]|uniref:hypothetical protein n=1 Tax=Collinsella aerofaciens TaxID=74426 RepID=UPI0011065629|nr:hypothetical protein [Collinsella aerofaciens]MDB1875650.1 hypothetical protein [Collinsella aerofaciens]MDB1877557.1 hypothetical protein [Collinsella aerofaciens]
MSKRKRIIALLVGVILLAGTAGTLAWLSVTGVLVNQFGIGSVTPSVQETLNGKVKSDVKAKNTGTAPAYIRAAVDIYWQDQDGARLWDEPKEEPKGEADYEIAWSVADASGANSAYNWVKASDGFYYWTSPVAPGAETGVLINRVTELKATEGRNLVVDISTQAVQATPDEAVRDAWGCSVENDVLVPPHGGA